MVSFCFLEDLILHVNPTLLGRVYMQNFDSKLSGTDSSEGAEEEEA